MQNSSHKNILKLKTFESNHLRERHFTPTSAKHQVSKRGSILSRNSIKKARRTLKSGGLC